MLRLKCRPRGRTPHRAPRVVLSRLRTSDAYKSTIKNLKINENTRVVYQGFTGKQATANAIQNLQWGTNVVGGVTPGKSGEHLGLPLLPSIKEAARTLKPDATAVFVAAQYAAKAIEDAVEAEIPLVVAVAEHIPIHDMLRIHSILQTQSKTRLVGANCPGIISPPARCRIGFLPHTVFSPGCISVVGKSGTLSYEAVASTSRVGLGQKLVVGMGGDWLAGTSLVDAVQVFLEDEETEGIIVIGEIGGRAELEVVEFLETWNGRKKPVMGLIAGTTAPEGRVMGHAGAIRGPGDMSATQKRNILAGAGITMVDHPGQFGDGMLRLLGRKPANMQRRRQIHTVRRRPSLRPAGSTGVKIQKGTLVLTGSAAKKTFFNLFFLENVQEKTKLVEGASFPQIGTFILKDDSIFDTDVVDSNYTDRPKWDDNISVGIGIERSLLCPCIIGSRGGTEFISIPFDYREGVDGFAMAEKLSRRIHLPSRQIQRLINLSWKIFRDHEAYSVVFNNIMVSEEGRLVVPTFSSTLHFDDAAYKSARRVTAAYTFRKAVQVELDEVEAEQHGIVFVRLDGPGEIGCLVNGAGLAMNTNDALVNYGGHPANFLDTGGKATKETIKEGFRLILKDSRVRVVFVNIFGGLTLGDMIADGIIMAFQDLGITVPVVVRIRGTNEEVGQQKIAASGLPLFAFDDLEDAAKKAIELAREANSDSAASN